MAGMTSLFLILHTDALQVTFLPCTSFVYLRDSSSKREKLPEMLALLFYVSYPELHYEKPGRVDCCGFGDMSKLSENI